MMKIVLSVIAISITSGLFAQDSTVWVSFYDSASQKFGYKDIQGNIKKPPQYLQVADTFYNITAAFEEKDGKYRFLHLLKDGRELVDHLPYSFEGVFDLESEETIRFIDKGHDSMGFLGKNGEVKIQAVYNTVTPFKNGMATALKGATRKCFDEKVIEGSCEHYGWTGGKLLLINRQNEVLVDSIGPDVNDLDWYSLKLNTPGLDTSLYKTIKGRNNTTYSFIHFQKQFTHWLYNEFVPSLSSAGNTWKDHLFDLIFYRSSDADENALDAASFEKMPGIHLLQEAFREDSLNRVYISRDFYLFDVNENTGFMQLFNSGGKYDEIRYPAFEVEITHYKRRTQRLEQFMHINGTTFERDAFDRDHEADRRENFSFIRTAKGYRLFAVSASREENR